MHKQMLHFTTTRRSLIAESAVSKDTSIFAATGNIIQSSSKEQAWMASAKQWPTTTQVRSEATLTGLRSAFTCSNNGAEPFQGESALRRDNEEKQRSERFRNGTCGDPFTWMHQKLKVGEASFQSTFGRRRCHHQKDGKLVSSFD